MMLNQNLLRTLGTFTLVIAFSIASQAREFQGKSLSPKPSVDALSKMMECEPPVAYTEFSLNNVRFGLEAGGQLWENNGSASYEVPKIDPASGESSIHSLYAGALWIGGYSPDGQLKLAAVTYRTGGATDFYNGPLSNNNFATADFCNTPGYSEFDDHFKANRNDVSRHRAYYISQIEGTTEELFPDGYVTPSYFMEWPGYNSDPNYASFLAPYVDWDGNGIYEPSQGDYPAFDLDNAIDCRTRAVTDPIPLFGDECIWWVFNDNGGLHTETGGQQIGMEIQAQAFAYTTTDEINNMTFYNYVLINRGVQTLRDCYFGQWVDPDVGGSEDDYVGCDVQRGLGYAFNGDDNDEGDNGAPGYGPNPPAVGIDFFEGPFQDPDWLGLDGVSVVLDSTQAMLDENGYAIAFDNPLSEDLSVVNEFNGIPYKGIGIGYGDGIGNNERFGMRRFVYYNRSGQPGTIAGVNDEPNTAIEFYSYLNGVWKNGQSMTYGGNGIGGTSETNYMFPALTDPVGFATNGQEIGESWTEEEEGNPTGDRRFIQSAGTFQLDPGEFNNVTVGVVWVRPFADPATTLNALKIADDKAQSLFDNCFRILSGPDAPDMTAQELNREIILYLENENPTSNNFQESYGYPSDFAFDPLIPGVTSEGNPIPEEGHYYEFQGYKIFQLKNGTVSSSELSNPDLAREIAQTDIQDGITQLINYVDSPELGQKVPVLGVNGVDEGIGHSFRITQDAFATEGTNLINFKKYYFMAVAYAYNNYEVFDPSAGDGVSGQAITYLESRKTANGAIPVVIAIPHDPTLENQGTVLNSTYGQIIPVTRLEGEGNGGNVIDLSAKSTADILSSAYNTVKSLEYVKGLSPVSIKVVDPLGVKGSDFVIGLAPRDNNHTVFDVSDDWELDELSDIGWFLIDQNAPDDTIFSQNAIDIGGEQLLIAEYGISIAIEQYQYPRIEGPASDQFPDFLEATLTFDDPNNAWLTGVEDTDNLTEQNWIRSGSNSTTTNGDECDPDDPEYYLDKTTDPKEEFERVLGGMVSPWHLVAGSWYGPAGCEDNFQTNSSTRLIDLNNVDIKFTSNKEHWTRTAVLEIQHFPELASGGAEKLRSRIALSVDKNGKNQLNGGSFDECTMNGQQVFDATDLEELSSTQITAHIVAAWPGEDPLLRDETDLEGLSFGMGWFPGYAIDVESGERLNMAFAESSNLPSENGADMLWNPTETLWQGFGPNSQNVNNARFGGMHYVYVFRNHAREKFANPAIRMPHYDNSTFIYKNINGGNTERKRVFRSCTWVYLPLLEENATLRSVEDGLIPNDALIRLRIAKPYQRYATVENFYGDYLYADDDYPYFFWDPNSGVENEADYVSTDILNAPVDPSFIYAENDWLPYYTFSTEEFSTSTGVLSVLEGALDDNKINVVPNPYYGIADDERGRLDTRVRITNLPSDRRAIIRIYDTGGVLVRTLDKDSPETFIEWDLKNGRNVPIAGGVHIFHISIPGVGEKIVKWFGVMRPVDLNDF